MTGKVDFASLLKGYAQDGWLDADIYAMEKGVAWQNKDRLWWTCLIISLIKQKLMVGKQAVKVSILMLDL